MARVAFRLYEKVLVLMFASQATIYGNGSLHTVGMHYLRDMATRESTAIFPLSEIIRIATMLIYV